MSSVLLEKLLDTKDMGKQDPLAVLWVRLKSFCESNSKSN